MLFYENVTVRLMSLEVGKNSGTAILLISAVTYAFLSFLIDFVPLSTIRYESVRNTNYSFGRIPKINIKNMT